MQKVIEALETIAWNDFTKTECRDPHIDTAIDLLTKLHEAWEARDGYECGDGGWEVVEATESALWSSVGAVEKGESCES